MSMNKKNTLVTILFIAALFIPFELSNGWGFKAHMRINSDAVDTLPAGMREFFESERNFISEHASDPDNWRRDDKEEIPHHFIDIDMYGTYPFKELPRDYDEAVKKFGPEAVNFRGTLPWRIVEYTMKLSEDMKSGDRENIRMSAAALGHYVGDAHVPLHSAENYDGQFTNNEGIHKQFEKLMVNSYMEEYDPSMPEAEPIADPLGFAFDIILNGYQLILPILIADSKAREGLSDALIDSLADRKADPVKSYIDMLYRDVGDIAWKQMSGASGNLGRYWVTAWDLAGRPSLPR